MKLSGPEVNSRLRDKLENPRGRHMYVVLGSYDLLAKYEREDYPEARTPIGTRLPAPINLSKRLLDRLSDADLKSLVQDEAKRHTYVQRRLEQELDRFLAEEFTSESFVALKQLELLYAYDMEFNALRTRAVNQKHILLLVPGERFSERTNLFHEAPTHFYRTMPANIVPEDHLWELTP